MKTKPVDYFTVPANQGEMHDRLERWARWVIVRRHGWQTHPMFRQYRSHAWQWHTPEVVMPVNLVEALATEKAVASLPEKHRDSIRWCYVSRSNPTGCAQKLGVSKDGLLELIDAGRAMLKNKLR